MVVDCFRNHRKKLFLIFIVVYLVFAYSIYNVIFIKKIGYKNYSVVPVSGQDMSDMTGFASLIKRSNSITAGDLFTEQYKRIKGISPNLSILVMKLFSHLFGGIKNAFIILNILMPIIYLLLIFYFFIKILKLDYFSSILAGVSVLTLTDIVNSVFNFHFHNIISSFFNFAEGKYQFSYFGRLPHIEVSFAFILLFFILFVMAIERRKLIYSVFAGISYGLLFYTYFYYWVYATVFLLVFLTVSLVRRRRQHALTTLFVSFFGVTIGLYYIILYIRFRSLPIYGDYILKIGTVFFRNIEKKSIFETILLIGGIIGIKKGKLKSPDYLIISFLSTISVVMNIQVFTGYTIEPEHFRITVWTPFIILFAIYYLSAYIKTKSAKTIILFVSIILPLFPLISNIHFARKNIKCYSEINDVDSVCQYITANEQGKIIATDNVFVNSALSYKTNNPLFLSNGFYNYLKADDILERESIILKIEGKDSTYFDSLLINSSIESHCGESPSKYNQKAWLFYFLHTYYFNYRINGSYITPTLFMDVHEIYRDAEINNERFDVLVTESSLSAFYKKYFKKVYVFGKYSIYERGSFLNNP